VFRYYCARTIRVQRVSPTTTSHQPLWLRASKTAATLSVNERPPQVSPTIIPEGKSLASRASLTRVTTLVRSKDIEVAVFISLCFSPTLMPLPWQVLRQSIFEMHSTNVEYMPCRCAVETSSYQM